MQLFHQTSDRLSLGGNYTFQFKAAPAESWFGKIVSFPFQIASQLYRLFFKVQDPRLLITSTPAVGRALLKGHRHTPENGLFFTKRDNLIELVEGVCPSESEKATSDDLIFACNEAWTNKYRRALLSFLKPKNIETHRAEIEKCIEETVEELAGKEGQLLIGAAEFSLTYSTAMVSKALLGHLGPLETYHEIGQAGSYVVNGAKLLSLPGAKEFESVKNVEVAGESLLKAKEIVDKKLTALNYLKNKRKEATEEIDEIIALGSDKQYEKRQATKLAILRAAVETSFNSSETPLLGPLVQKLREQPEFGQEQFSDLQIKSLILSLYIAGSETTSSVLTCLLCELANNPEYQEKIFQEVSDQEGSLLEIANNSPAVKRLLAEALRLFTPVFGIERIAARDLVCSAEDEEHHEVYRKTIPKGTSISYDPSLAGESLYPDKEESLKFDPDRSDPSLGDLSWLPFGHGRHACPGQSLAKAEILGFITSLVQKYKILPVTKEKPVLEEAVTTKRVKKEIFIRLDRRSSENILDITRLDQ